MLSEVASRFVPFASGTALVVSGAWQLTPWKLACLQHCRNPIHLLAAHLGPGSRRGFGFGIHHGAYCVGCCWGLMLMLFVLGVMNLSAMLLVAMVVAGEKLLGRGERIAQGTGIVAIVAGMWLAARAFL